MIPLGPIVAAALAVGGSSRADDPARSAPDGGVPKDPDAEVIENLELLEQLEILDNFEILDRTQTERKEPGGGAAQKDRTPPP